MYRFFGSNNFEISPPPIVRKSYDKYSSMRLRQISNFAITGIQLSEKLY
jgi:hypothetical protein